MTATLFDPRISGAEIVEFIAFHTDEDGTRSASVVLHTGDVVDAELLDVNVAA